MARPDGPAGPVVQLADRLDKNVEAQVATLAPCGSCEQHQLRYLGKGIGYKSGSTLTCSRGLDLMRAVNAIIDDFCASSNEGAALKRLDALRIQVAQFDRCPIQLDVLERIHHAGEDVVQMRDGV